MNRRFHSIAKVELDNGATQEGVLRLLTDSFGVSLERAKHVIRDVVKEERDSYFGQAVERLKIKFATLEPAKQDALIYNLRTLA